MTAKHWLEQPVRLVAVLVFGPVLIYIGLRSAEWLVVCFGVGLILVDGFFIAERWLRESPAREAAVTRHFVVAGSINA